MKLPSAVPFLHLFKYCNPLREAVGNKEACYLSPTYSAMVAFIQWLDRNGITAVGIESGEVDKRHRAVSGP